MIERKTYRVGHLFCGLGGFAKGFNRATARVKSLEARWECAGGIDHDPAALRDFEKLSGVRGTLIDLFDRRQYADFHGHEPPADWREATPADVRAAFGPRLHALTLSAPCKGFSGLLSETASRTDRYQALNRLTVRGLFLVLEAYRDNPIELLIFENVPRIATRGRGLLDQIKAMFDAFGYVSVETDHDCGEIGGLAQSRKRFLLVARHRQKVRPFLYEPPKHRLRGVGSVLERIPLPLSGLCGPMHRMPSLQWKTWVRLAFVQAGRDWRSLNDLRVHDGVLSDFGILPEIMHNGGLGVRRWSDPAHTVTSNGRPAAGSFSVADPRPHLDSDRPAYGVGDWTDPAATVTSQRSPGQGRFAVADPRINGHPKSVQHGVRRWDEPAGVVTGKMFVGGGPHAVADPRVGRKAFNNLFRIVPWDSTSPAVTGPGGPAGGLAVADPRAPEGSGKGKYRITGYDAPTNTVISASTTGQGAFAVADPRAEALRVDRRDNYQTAGLYGIVPWQSPSGAIAASGQIDNGRWAVADPRTGWDKAHQSKLAVRGWDDTAKTVTGSDRVGSGAPSVADPREFNVVPDGPASLPGPSERLVCVIRALDDTWHRPFTTFELAALQSLVDPDEVLELDGLSDAAWRERIGNAVPPGAAQAIGEVMARTLLLSDSGETFILSSESIWVRNLAVALSVDDRQVLP